MFLLLASHDPMRHLSPIWFMVWPSIVHGMIMVLQVLMGPADRGHLQGDLSALFIVAALLWVLTPRGEVPAPEKAS